MTSPLDISIASIRTLAGLLSLVDHYMRFHDQIGIAAEWAETLKGGQIGGLGGIRSNDIRG